MARIRENYGSSKSGKLNKKSKEVYRVTNGREFTYTIEHPYEGPASKAQKAHRELFGKANAMVNVIMADPIQTEEWRARMNAYHAQRDLRDPKQKRYDSLRQYVYAVISEQLKNKPAAKRRKASLPFTLPRGVTMQVKLFSDLSAAELYEILKARFSVFVCEQHIIYLDEDNIDYLSTHYAFRKKGIVIAYARTFPDKEANVLCVGRMLTIERGKGYGKYLMEQIAMDAARQGYTKLRLHAQTHAVPFYAQLGFHSVGDIFIEADIPHILMEKAL